MGVPLCDDITGTAQPARPDRRDPRLATCAGAWWSRPRATASGIGTTRYGAQLVVVADSEDEAVRLATDELARAAAQAGLPAWPVTRAEAVSELDDMADDE